MSNPYYTFSPDFVPGTKARAGEVNVQFLAIEAAFDFLPSVSGAVTRGTTYLGLESGTGNVYVVNTDDPRLANQEGDLISFKATHSNTGAITLSVDGIAAVSARGPDDVLFSGGEIVSGRYYTFRYNAAISRFGMTEGTDAANKVIYAAEWANKAHNSLVSTAAGGDGVDDYSALHWATEAATSALGVGPENMAFRGDHNAGGNTAPATPADRSVYRISVAGTFAGIAWKANDYTVYNGTTWERLAKNGGAAYSVLGVAGALGTTYADITSSADNQVLKRSLGALTWSQVEYADIQDTFGVSVLGRAANSVGVIAAIVAGANDRLLIRTSNTLSFGQLTAGMFPSTVVPDAALSTNVPLLNAANAFTAAQAITVADASVAIRLKGATGFLRVRPYVDATFGAIIDSVNAAENANLPMTLSASALRLTSATFVLINGDVDNQLRYVAGATGSNRATYQTWYKNDDTTRRGYLGYTSTGDETMALVNELGNINITPASGSSILVTQNLNGNNIATWSNASAGASAITGINLTNSTNTLFMRLLSTGFSGTHMSGQAAGEAAMLATTGAVQLGFGTNSTARINIAGTGAVSVLSSFTMTASQGVIDNISTGSNNTLLRMWTNSSHKGGMVAPGGSSAYLTGDAIGDLDVYAVNGKINFSATNGPRHFIIDSSVASFQTGEVRNYGDSAFFSFYNTTGSTRSGYVQATSSGSMAVRNEVASGVLTVLSAFTDIEDGVGLLGTSGNTIGWGVHKKGNNTTGIITAFNGGGSRITIASWNAAAFAFNGIGTTASAANAFLDSGASNSLLRSTSSRAYKKDIEDMTVETMEKVLELRPVQYRSKAAADDKSKIFYGLIAEEVAAVDPSLVHYSNGKPDGVMYDRVFLGLIGLVRDLRAEVAALKAA